MATTLKIIEAKPETYPIASTTDETTTEEVAQFDKIVRATWQRVESYIAFRWGERTCVFTVE
ncbi:MAG: hypothetical protein AAGJ87_15655, partial [Pseudomonadota bacterium]